jgi:hypothetical protein
MSKSVINNLDEALADVSPGGVSPSLDFWREH